MIASRSERDFAPVLPDEERFFLHHATWHNGHERTMDFFRRRLQP